MIDYFLNNIEWIFSGIGVFFIALVSSIFIKRQPNSQGLKKEHSSSVVDNSVVEKPITLQPIKETDAKKISNRFCYVLQLMNEDYNYTKFTIPKLAQIMGLEKVSDLEKVFLGIEEPSFKFISDFCRTFGVDSEWIIEGKSAPFNNKGPYYYDPIEFFFDIPKLKPERVFFIRAKTKTAQTFILLRLSDWKFLILPKIWHISDHVGAGGQGQILSFYMLINKLRDEGYYNICGGRTLSEKHFNSLYSGDEYPGKYIEQVMCEDHWWDDLTDIYHEYPIAQNYEHCHGKSLIQAQEIIKWRIKGKY